MIVTAELSGPGLKDAPHANVRGEEALVFGQDHDDLCRSPGRSSFVDAQSKGLDHFQVWWCLNSTWSRRFYVRSFLFFRTIMQKWLMVHREKVFIEVCF